MPYLTCPDCGDTHYSVTAHSAGARCSHCGERLPIAPGAPSSTSRPTAAIADIVALQQRIATRIRHGGSLADVRREIIEVSSLDEAQRDALWLYAASQPQIRRAATPFAGVNRWGA